MDKNNWQNRIVGYKEVPASELLANPMNARRHPAAQREALRGSLDTLGWVAPILVNVNTNMLIDGHARVEEMLTKDENALVPVIEVNISEDEEKLFLASFDWITQLAIYDMDSLGTLLHEVQTDDTRLQAMLNEMAETNYIAPETMDLGNIPGIQEDNSEDNMIFCPHCGFKFHVK